MNKERGLFIGRFNPFHLGHLKAIEHILTQEKEIIIAIGSTQQSHTTSDPFTAGERLLMIRAALKEAKIPLERIFVVSIPDIHRNSVWVSHLRSYCPPFRYIYTNNSLTKRLFMEAGMEVRSTGPFNRNDLKGTQIRRYMAEGKEWHHMVPKAVLDVIESINGLNRLQDIIHETD
ncbi:MAG: nicotinamide-nucleotide adenylyltransferase [Candidatus Hodarchaeales archaeon]|jgi:nicotinamide-nucleotide adenylyltransferase